MHGDRFSFVHGRGRIAVGGGDDRRGEEPQLFQRPGVVERFERREDAWLFAAFEDLLARAHADAVDELLHCLTVRYCAPDCCAAADRAAPGERGVWQYTVEAHGSRVRN